MQTRTYVDFSEVLPQHRIIDERLANWGRWNFSSSGFACSPMFRLYRAPDHWHHAYTSTPIDTADARRIQWAMQYLPIRVRLALAWAYIYGFVSPGKTARAMEVSINELHSLVIQGRQCMIDARA